MNGWMDGLYSALGFIGWDGVFESSFGGKGVRVNMVRRSDAVQLSSAQLGVSVTFFFPKVRLLGSLGCI